MELTFKEANLQERKKLVSELNDFILASPHVKLGSNGKVEIKSRIMDEEGEIELVDAFIDGEILTYVAKEKEKIVGYCFAAKYKDRSVQLTHMSMRKGYARKGIGRKLIDFMHNDLASNKKVRLVNLIAHVGAIDFYEKKSPYKRRNLNTKRPKSFWNPFGRAAQVFGARLKRK